MQLLRMRAGCVCGLRGVCAGFARDLHGICVGFVQDLCRICINFVGFAFWVGSKRMGKQQKRRDSFPPTLPLYNIKGCNDVWLAIRIT